MLIVHVGYERHFVHEGTSPAVPHRHPSCAIRQPCLHLPLEKTWLYSAKCSDNGLCHGLSFTVSDCKSTELGV